MINGIPLPRHINISLEHNGHRIMYQSVMEYCEMVDPCFVSKEEKEKSFQSDEIWEAVWHPDTPVGSLHYAARDLNVLLNHIKDME